MMILEVHPGSAHTASVRLYGEEQTGPDLQPKCCEDLKPYDVQSRGAETLFPFYIASRETRPCLLHGFQAVVLASFYTKSLDLFDQILHIYISYFQPSLKMTELLPWVLF